MQSCEILNLYKPLVSNSFVVSNMATCKRITTISVIYHMVYELEQLYTEWEAGTVCSLPFQPIVEVTRNFAIL